MREGRKRKYVLPTEYGIEVYQTEERTIAIRQDRGGGSFGPPVEVALGRVECLIAYLRMVKDDIQTCCADEAEATPRLNQPIFGKRR